MTLTSILIIFAVFLILSLLWAEWRALKISSWTWEERVAQLKPVRIDAVAKIAQDPQTSSAIYTPRQMWDLIGGAEGLARMEENSEVLIVIASFVGTVAPNPCAEALKRMRSERFRLRRAAFWLRWNTSSHSDFPSASLHLRQAALSYYDMVQRLLVLYQESHVGRYGVLRAACNIEFVVPFQPA